MLVVETEVAAPGWEAATDWAALSVRACTAALAQTPHAGLDRAGYAVEVAVRLSDDAEVRTLNAQYRHKDVANSDDGEVLLGDIILAFETVAAEAAAKGIDVAAHATHLIAHGLLHLLGYDHGDDAAAAHMEGLETVALARLGLADPYA